MERCKSCGGTFTRRQRDGALYFHACAPQLELRKQDGTIITAAQATTERTAGRPVTETFVDRPNKRDENVRVTGVDDSGRSLTRATSEGDGVETVP